MNKFSLLKHSIIATITIALYSVPLSVAAQISRDWCDDYNGYCAPSGAPVAEVKGRIASVATSTTSSSLQFVLENQPTFHRFCDISRFLVSKTEFFDLIVDSKNDGREIIVAYSPASGCVNGYVRVWSVLLE